MTRLHLWALCAFWALSACALDEPVFVEGVDVLDVSLSLHTEDMGVHPDESVLSDPNNPFRHSEIVGETRWRILANAPNVTAFYAWATILARQPMGETQFYVAIKLRDIYLTGDAAQSALPIVRAMAIRAFQAVLDHFPDALSFDASGNSAVALAPAAYDEIVALGGRVRGRWVRGESAEGPFLVELPSP